MPRNVSTGIIRVVVADDHAVVRAGLRALLAACGDIQIVGEAGTGRGALALVERLMPHVAVLDLDMPQMGGVAATSAIVQQRGTTRVLILSMQVDDDDANAALAAGAAGVLVKHAADRELASAIRAVAAGEGYPPPRVQCQTHVPKLFPDEAEASQ